MEHHTQSLSLIPVKPSVAARAHVTKASYESLYAESIRDPESFWARQAEDFYWFSPWKKVKETSFAKDVSIRWFVDGKTNISVNCVDRHLASHGDKTAILWEPDSPDSKARHITYKELHRHVCKLANVLKANGVGKGDRVMIYMPMVPEAAYAMLACARIGAVHAVVFGGFSPDSLRGRIADCGGTFLITADEGLRGGKKVPLKANVDEALAEHLSPGSETKENGIKKVFVLKHTGGAIDWTPGRDLWWHEEMEHAAEECPPEVMDAEDPLFILYTSGSTGKPKGIVHTTAGYMVYAALTHKVIFDVHDDDIYWCTADVGWVTGHSYIVYGPLANAATTLMFEGVPHYPDASRFWQVIDKHNVSIFYTAPTAIRSLMREGTGWLDSTSRASLRVLGSVGEPINPEVWLWYYEQVGGSRCPVVDTWWQTETGGILISPLPGAIDQKPGAATVPFFGVQPVMLDASNGAPIEGEGEGVLALKDSWPGQARTIYGDHQRFVETYFSQYPGYYFSGDGCKRDADGYWWITGRVDDVLNVSGHRIGTAEVESALVAHPKVAEAAVVGAPHAIKGQGIYAYVTLNQGESESAALEKELKEWVRKQIGPIAAPDWLQFTPALPKTRSGKIMRRILRKIAENDFSSLGDISTLLNPEAVQQLIENRSNKSES